MASLGAPVTGQNIIGTFEVRIGPQASAGKLRQSHSVGVIDSFTLDLRQETADMLAGFPQEPADTAIVSQVSGLSFQMREYSVRNLNMMLGNGVVAQAGSNYVGRVDTAAAVEKDAESLVLNNDSSAPVVGDTLTIHHATDRSLVFVVYVKSASTASGQSTIGFEPSLPLGLEAGGDYRAYKTAALAFGQQSKVQYFSCGLVQLDRANNQPLVFDFWKAALETGPQISTGGAEFASTEVKLKFLEPTISEHATIYPDIYTEFAEFPVGRYVMAQDVQ